MGFCLFDNIAIAAELAIARARRSSGSSIFDWDVHHGNGTAEAFRRRADVLFASIHQAGIFPGTGAAGDVGSGAGEGYTINLPVPAGCERGGLALAARAHRRCRPPTEFAPDLVLVSAGFDAHRDDPLAELPPRDRVLRPDGAATSATLAAGSGAPLGRRARGRLRTCSRSPTRWPRRSPRSAARARRSRPRRSRCRPPAPPPASPATGPSEQAWPGPNSSRSHPAGSTGSEHLLGDDYGRSKRLPTAPARSSPDARSGTSARRSRGWGGGDAAHPPPLRPGCRRRHALGRPPRGAPSSSS